MLCETDEEIILQMLELYKDMRYLWDRKDKDYNNKTIRYNGFGILLNIYKQVDENATIRKLIKKIQNLRTNYIKEYKRAKESRETATCPKDIYEPTLFYYNALSFLEDCYFPSDEPWFSVRVLPKIELQEHPSPSSSLSHPESDHLSLSETSSIIPKKKRKFSKTNRPVMNQDEMNRQDKPMKMKDEELEVLGKAIGIQLRDLNNKQLTIAQKIISDAIYYAKIGLLTENAYVALKPLVKPEAPDLSHLPSTSTYPEISFTYNSSGNPLKLKMSPQSSPDDDADL